MTARVSDDDIWHAIGLGDVSQIQDWVRSGLNLETWKSENGRNIYHYCRLWNTVEALHVAEEVGGLCFDDGSLLALHDVTAPLTKISLDGDYYDDYYDIAFIEYFIRQSHIRDFYDLIKAATNAKIVKYLKWRQRHKPAGLPDFIRRENNKIIMEYIEANESYSGSSKQEMRMRVSESRKSRVSDDEIWHAVGNGDLSQIQDWVCDGLDLTSWRSSTGRNIYHYCRLWNTIEALHVAEAVSRICDTHIELLAQEQNWGKEDPLLESCLFGDCCEDNYDIAFMDFFIRQVHTADFKYMIARTSHGNMIKYLRWRQKTTGLPESIRREQNGLILKYIDTVESMDRNAARRYQHHMQRLYGTSRNIRIYFVGYQGVGKSTLCGKMRGVSTDGLTSTDLMEAFIQRLIVDMATGKRKTLPDDIGHQLALDKINKEMNVHDVMHGKAESKTVLHQFKRLFLRSSKRHTKVKEHMVMPAPFPVKGSHTRQHLVIPDPHSIEKESEGDEKATACAAEMIVKRKDEILDHQSDDAYVSMWDFGGEELFLNTNHLFISCDAVYFLVFDLVKSMDPTASMRARLTFWLRTIDSLSNEQFTPPVILIGTFLDRLSGKNNTERIAKAKSIYRDIVNTTELKQLASENVMEFIPIDNTQEDPSIIDRIWRAVVNAAYYQSHWNTPLPLTWLAIEREIMLLKSQNIKMMNLQDALDIGKNLEFDISDSDNCVMDCLLYLHRIGVVIYLGSISSDQPVIIDPLWLVRGFRLIITVPKFQQRSQETNDMLDHYNKTGEIPLKLIRLLLSQGEKYDNFADHEDVLLFYMERLDLITRPLTKGGLVVGDTFLVPCFLPVAEPEKLRPVFEDPETTRTASLSFVFRNAFISSPVYDKVLASCIHCFEVAAIQGLGGRILLQRGFGCFKLNPRWNMAIHCNDGMIKITLFTERKISVQPSDGFYVRYIMTTILNSVLTINQQQHLVNTYDLCLDKTYQVVSEGKMVSVDNLEWSSKKMPCSGLKGDNTVQRSDLDVWFADPKLLPRTQEISLPLPRDLMNRTPNPRELSHIAKYIDTSYRMFLIEIGLNSYEIDQEDRWRQECFRTFVTNLLVKWSYKLGPSATFNVIYQVMDNYNIPTDRLLKELGHTQTDETDSEDALSQPEEILDTRPTSEHIDMVVHLMRKSYTIFYLELGLSIEEIEQAVMDFKPLESAFRTLLNIWLQRLGHMANLGKIIQAMEEANMNHFMLRAQAYKSHMSWNTDSNEAYI